MILKVYEEEGIKEGTPTNTYKGPAFKTELATAYPDCRLVITKDYRIVLPDYNNMEIKMEPLVKAVYPAGGTCADIRDGSFNRRLTAFLQFVMVFISILF